MAGRDPVPLSPAEWKVMKILWRRGSCAARDAYEEAGQEVRAGMFPDRMLTRMGWACVEETRETRTVSLELPPGERERLLQIAQQTLKPLPESVPAIPVDSVVIDAEPTTCSAPEGDSEPPPISG